MLQLSGHPGLCYFSSDKERLVLEKENVTSSQRRGTNTWRCREKAECSSTFVSCLSACVYVCTYVCLCVYICVHVCSYVCSMCVHVSVCVHVRVCTMCACVCPMCILYVHMCVCTHMFCAHMFTFLLCCQDFVP